MMEIRHTIIFCMIFFACSLQGAEQSHVAYVLLVRSTDPLNRMKKEDQIEVSRLLNSLNADFLCLEARSDLRGLLVPLKQAHSEAEVIEACSRIPGVKKAQYYTEKP